MLIVADFVSLCCFGFVLVVVCLGFGLVLVFGGVAVAFVWFVCLVLEGGVCCFGLMVGLGFCCGLDMNLVGCLLIDCCCCLYYCWLGIWLWVAGFWWVLLVCAFGIALFVRFMIVVCVVVTCRIV